jgi:large subunit ribosomal protein L25
MSSTSSKQIANKVFSIIASYRNVSGTRRCQELRHNKSQIPGIVYGGPQNKEKILVKTSQVDVASLLRERGQSFASTLVDVKIQDEYEPDNQEISKTFRCVPRSLTLHHLHDYPLSCNWMIHDPIKGVKVNLPIFFEDKDKCPGLKRGAVLSRMFWHLPCLVKGPALPDGIHLSVAGLQVGDRLRWSDVKWDQLPPGVSVECLMFRMESFRKANVNNLTLVSVEGGKATAEEDQNKEEALDKI